jgi:hypothetical protein
MAGNPSDLTCGMNCLCSGLAFTPSLQQMKNFLNPNNEIDQALAAFKSTFTTVGVFSALAGLRPRAGQPE